MKRMLHHTAAILLAMALLIALLPACTVHIAQTAAEFISQGERYLLGLDYEQALTKFFMAIEIAPRNPRGYIGAAEAYRGLDRRDYAVAVLERGLEVVGPEESMQMMLGELLGKADTEPDVAPTPVPGEDAGEDAEPEPDAEPIPEFTTDLPGTEPTPPIDPHGDYILPFSSTRTLTDADLRGLTGDELRIARNEIYARYGRQFNDQTLQDYFNAKSWYAGLPKLPIGVEPTLTPLELSNIDFIMSYEE